MALQSTESILGIGAIECRMKMQECQCCMQCFQLTHKTLSRHKLLSLAALGVTAIFDLVCSYSSVRLTVHHPIVCVMSTFASWVANDCSLAVIPSFVERRQHLHMHGQLLCV